MQQQHLIVPHARIAETANNLGFSDAHRIRRRTPAGRVTITPMNDLPTLPIQRLRRQTGRDPAAAPPQPEPSLLETLQQPQMLLVGIVAILLAGQTWSSHARSQAARRNGAACKRATPATPKPAPGAQRAGSTKELQGKVALLESKQQEAQSQQLALEQLYQDLSKNRDEWALTEIEQVLSTASQQLQLAGNVPGALIALQNADRSLSRSDKPQFITIRRAIAADTDA
jgi:uroporphyrin-3 C-methyltransferase/uroporphyrinogen III methyltransferase/synthase